MRGLLDVPPMSISRMASVSQGSRAHCGPSTCQTSATDCMQKKTHWSGEQTMGSVQRMTALVSHHASRAHHAHTPSRIHTLTCTHIHTNRNTHRHSPTRAHPHALTFTQPH